MPFRAMLQRETEEFYFVSDKSRKHICKGNVFFVGRRTRICYNTAYDVLEEIQMKLRYRLATFLLAAGLVFSNTAVHEVCAAEVEGAAAAVTDEEKAVYEMPVESNALKNWPEGPGIFAEAGIIMDMNSGAILYAKNIDEKEFPASITKIMTALVALENSELTDKVHFTEESVAFLEYGDASIGMQPGEETTMEDALYGMLLASANEVSYAIADTVGNGYDNFIRMMNEKAEELGCTNTHFTNPHGLHDEEHYVSARDMALIASAAFQHEEFRKITNTYEHRIPPTNLVNEERVFQQYHQMLYDGTDTFYEPCVGGKTGYTDQALSTLVSYLDNGELQLVSVNLKTHGVHVYPDTKNMAEYVFNNFKKIPLEGKDLPKGVKETEEDAYIVVPKNVEFQDVKAEIVPEDKSGKSKKGTLTYTYDGQTVGVSEVVLKDSYFQTNTAGTKTEKNETDQKEQKPLFTVSPKVKMIIGIVVSVIIAMGLIFCALVYRKRQRRRQRRLMEQRRRRQRKEKQMRQSQVQTRRNQQYQKQKDHTDKRNKDYRLPRR